LPYGCQPPGCKPTEDLPAASVLWYGLASEGVRVRHIIVISAITLSLFAMLWLGVVVFKLSAIETTVASGLTVVLIGLGLLITTGAFRRPPPQE